MLAYDLQKGNKGLNNGLVQMLSMYRATNIQVERQQRLIPRIPKTLHDLPLQGA